jgi:hypothetical protein
MCSFFYKRVRENNIGLEAFSDERAGKRFLEDII